ncbi:putative protein-arginine deiminase [Cordyceps militaris CM01]|uniref:Protein-arginine deiminase C-terminal domain-containing protein n=1 Tax=Cordyceps militaris (strain CM01) TaxID=983644 RepID=G3JTZ3_CORMM|nr:putative protein-arginine deiminase [Cordyceps militaris CM01]EGX88147.1 putative protein-arginine deiminase [Cordyceps militaris CM01]
MAGLLGASQALEVTILADTNRDGKIDTTGKSDYTGKNTWTESSGALFLANIGDSNRRCSSLITTDENDKTNPDYNLCNDASGDVQRNPKYLAPVLTLPSPELSDTATGSIVVDKVAASKVRVFLKDGADWAYVASNYTFTAGQLRKGLDLGVDAREVRTTAWDGKATLQFSVKDKGAEATDSVALRVAPVLTHHHVQPAEQVLVSMYQSSRLSPDKLQEKFVQDLTKLSLQAGVKQPFVTVNSSDHWTQDFFEPGYTTIPGPEGPVVLRIMIASAQNESRRIVSHRWLFREMRSDTVGAVQHRTYGTTTDSTGNLETVPPYTLNGKSYPAGRAIMGSHFGKKPEMVKFLKAQEVQAPVGIDTTWLMVGHTDEFMQFLPANNKRGWVMMVDDPLAGLEILQQAQKQGHGKVRAISRPKMPSDGSYCVPTNSIDDFLNLANFTEVQKYCDKNIKANIDILKNETGLTDSEIIRAVPAAGAANEGIYAQGYRQRPYVNVLEAGGGGKGPDGLARRQADDTWQVAALYPGCINGVVLSNTQYAAPNPWGPVVDGKDILASAVNAAYAKANFTVHYMDDFFTHHVESGEVHCGSNVIRGTTAKWW